jgi:hypothetical protein
LYALGRPSLSAQLNPAKIVFSTGKAFEERQETARWITAAVQGA